MLDERGLNGLDTLREMYLVADELRSIADVGMCYAVNEYDRVRYERLLSLSAQLIASIDKRPVDKVMEEYEGSLA